MHLLFEQSEPTKKLLLIEKKNSTEKTQVRYRERNTHNEMPEN
jgi:hypothetical protein